MIPPTREAVVEQLRWQIEHWRLLNDARVRLRHVTQELADHQIACLEAALEMVVKDKSKVATAQDLFG